MPSSGPVGKARCTRVPGAWPRPCLPLSLKGLLSILPEDSMGWASQPGKALSRQAECRRGSRRREDVGRGEWWRGPGARQRLNPLKTVPGGVHHRPILQIKKLRQADRAQLARGCRGPRLRSNPDAGDPKAHALPQPGPAQDRQGAGPGPGWKGCDAGRGEQQTSRPAGQPSRCQPRLTRSLSGTRAVLTSRTAPAGRGRRRASASGTWATRRPPARTACSSRPLCSGASLAGREEPEGCHLLPFRPPPGPQAPHGLQTLRPHPGGSPAPPDDNCISLIISMEPGHASSWDLSCCSSLSINDLGTEKHSEHWVDFLAQFSKRGGEGEV